MKNIDLLKMHLVPPISLDDHNLDRILEIWAEDCRCFVEHDIIGSTREISDNPWIPYALLAGSSVEEVNAARRKRNEEDAVRRERNEDVRTNVALGVFFGLPVGYIIFYEMQPVNPETLEVGTPRVIGARDQRTMKELTEGELRKLKYTGKYARIV